MLDEVKEISLPEAKALIQKYHYSKVMPRITKYAIGGFIKDELVAVCTLGWGVRPLHTIKKAFPILDTKDYYEIGKLCVSDDCPKNTESYFISRVIKWIKSNLDIKILFSWSDGIIGKPGYVYQASNFFYGGYIETEMYLNGDGVRVHARTMQGLSTGERVGKFKSRTYEVTKSMGYTKYFGYQFRYVYPIISNKKWKLIADSSPFEWARNGYPKDIDCKWKVQVKKGVHEVCNKPPFKITEYINKNNNVSNFFD